MKNDILAEFDSFLKSSSDGKTVAEICDATGISPTTVRRKIKVMMANGKAEHCGSKMCVDIAGISKPSPTYRMKKDAAKK